MSELSPEISIVIPVHNEEENISSVLFEIKDVMDKLGRSYEIIAVDDGSTDRTFEVLKENLSKILNLKIVKLTRNFGQHPALYAGFKYSRGNIIVTIDADGQNPAFEIPRLIKTLEEGNYDFVQGWRKERRDNIFRKLSSKIVNYLVRHLTGAELKDIGCGMFALTKKTAENLLQNTHHYRYIPTEVSWMGLRAYSLPISHRKREKGQSRYKLWSLFWINFDIITSISTLPVEILGVLGILFSLIGFIIALGMIIKKVIWNTPLDSITPVTSLFFLLTGVQILCTSILCAYLSRCYREVQDRPYFVVKEILGNEKDKNGNIILS